MFGIKDWLLTKVLDGRIIIFETDENEFIPINDITIEGNFLFCKYDPRDIEERMADYEGGIE